MLICHPDSTNSMLAFLLHSAGLQPPTLKLEEKTESIAAKGHLKGSLHKNCNIRHRYISALRRVFSGSLILWILTLYLSILFWLSACWFHRLRYCGRCRTATSIWFEIWGSWILSSENFRFHRNKNFRDPPTTSPATPSPKTGVMIPPNPRIDAYAVEISSRPIWLRILLHCSGCISPSLLQFVRWFDSIS